MRNLRATALLAACVWTAIAAPAAASQAGDDILIADFESPTYGSWTTQGDAFGPGPAAGTLPGQMRVDGFEGNRLVNSFVGGDAGTGTLTSPRFAIKRRYITFLIGGGKDLDRTCLQLVVDGNPVRVATGTNDRPGGSETLARQTWDVGELVGRDATIRIVDGATGGWGHINVDQIVQTDRKPPGIAANARRRFTIGSDLLNIPIRDGAPRRVVSLIVDGRVVVKNEIELADGTPDWWAPMDVGAWRGKDITLEVDALPDDSLALTSIEPGQTPRGPDGLYRETLRGQFHFSPRRGWTNDPNGLVFYRGEYHLFFQHNPYGWGWGNMHWGHAVSSDLVHWTELGEALAPDELGTMYSGSAVVDHRNTSGLGKPGEPALVLIYTAAGTPFTQCIASSTDGRVFTKSMANPAVRELGPENRDPKVFWHEPTGKWVMTLYVPSEGKHWIYFLGSANLREWTVLSRTEGLYECPDFFSLPLDGDAGRVQWVLTAASSEYMVGEFDGVTFLPQTPKLPGHRGRGFYAAQTFSDLPAADGRRIQIGWFQTETRGMPFNQSMSIPLELGLVSTGEGPRLTWTPARELQSLRARSHAVEPTLLREGSPDPLAGISAELVELRAEIESDDAEVVFTVRGATILYDAKSREVVVNGHRAPVPTRGGRVRLTVYCDRTGLEVFVGDGLTFVPMPLIAKAENRALGVTCRRGEARVSATVHELTSAWERR